MFNDYIWRTYLNAGGKGIVESFERNLTSEFSEDFIISICKFREVYCPVKAIINETREQLQGIAQDLNDNLSLLEHGEYTIESALQFIYKSIKGEDDYSAQKVFEYFSGSMEYFSTFLAIEIPSLFTPYYFKHNFNILEMISAEFDIKLPPIPAKKNYEDRFYYYGEICAALLEFREKHDMSPFELCAFLYDFAVNYIGGIYSYIIKDLPEPKSAFFIGGSANDSYLDYNENTITCWQCNPDTRVGDMIVMYLKTPVSAIDSFWRSVSIGFNDPFFYYYRCAYISNPVRITRINQRQLKEDDIFRSVSIVRKNMQGVNGVELKPSEYNRLVDLAKSDAPKLEFHITDANQDFSNEKDVENKLIKPLITRLGYTTDDYATQLYMEIGNHNRCLIPDFVLLPNTARGRQTAFALIEAKYSIPNKGAMEEAMIQARSYARQLKAEFSLIASKDRVWLYTSDDDYLGNVYTSTWEELNNADNFTKLFKLIGKR
ncbi:MAG: hypothetical protein Q4D04_11260 [Clostridia bacterium]|nr:hypothetical protein [Clostridia bacterium]